MVLSLLAIFVEGGGLDNWRSANAVFVGSCRGGDYG